MALRLGELSVEITADKAPFDRGVGAAESRMDRFGRHVDNVAKTAEQRLGAAGKAGGAAFGDGFMRSADGRLRDAGGRFVRSDDPRILAGGVEAGQSWAAGFVRGADGRIRDARGRFVKADDPRLRGQGSESGRSWAAGFVDRAGAMVKRGFSGMDAGSMTGLLGVFGSLGEAVGKMATSATKGASELFGLGSSAAAAAGPIGAVVAVVVAATAAMLTVAVGSSVAGAAVYALGGAFASLPAVAAGAAAGIGALIVGFIGIADQFKKVKATGGGAASSINQVAQAERNVARAQRDALRAQEDIARATAEEVEAREDLVLSLERAQLGERQAAQAVRDSRKALTEARASGDVEEIRRAKLAYDEAQLSVREAAERTGDLASEQQHATEVGVAGSDRVAQAYERQQQAMDALLSAQEALAQARSSQGGGGGGAAEELTKIAPSAAAAVAAIKAMKGAWEDLRLSVQERLFSGVGEEITKLGSVWLPQLKTQMGGFADSFNTIFKSASATLQDPTVVSGFVAGMESVRGVVDKIGAVVSGPILRAFSQLSEAAKPFVDAVGDEIAGVLSDLAKWINGASESGALSAFFEDASGFFRDVMSMGKDVGSIIGGALTAIMGSEKDAGKESPWDKIVTALHEIAVWFSDPENQEKVKTYFDLMMTYAGPAIDVLKWVVKWAIKIGLGIAEALDTILNAGDNIVNWFTTWRDRLSAVWDGLWDGLSNGFRAAVNFIIRGWNSLHFSIPEFNVPGIGRVGGASVSVPHIPELATGGTATSPGAAWVAERGPELIQMPRGATVTPLTGPNTPTGGDPALLARLVGQAVRQAVADLGGDVVVSVDGDVIERRALAAVRRNPRDVALAARTGTRRVAYT